MERKTLLLLGLGLIAIAAVALIALQFAGTVPPGPDSPGRVTQYACATLAAPSTLAPDAALDAAVSGVQAALDEIDVATAQAATALGPTEMAGNETRRVLARLADVSPAAIDATAVSKDGIMLTVEPAEYASAEGADIADQEQVRRLAETKQPVMSTVFATVEGVNATDLEHPVFAAGRFNGSASLLFRPSVLLTMAVQEALAGRSVEVFVVDTDGVVLYDRDATEIGSNTFTDAQYAGNTELLAIADRMRTQDQGTGSYTFAAEGSSTMVRKTVAWDSVGLHGTWWRVAVVTTVAPS